MCQTLHCTSCAEAAPNPLAASQLRPQQHPTVSDSCTTFVCFVQGLHTPAAGKQVISTLHGRQCSHPVQASSCSSKYRPPDAGHLPLGSSTQASCVGSCCDSSSPRQMQPHARGQQHAAAQASEAADPLASFDWPPALVTKPTTCVPPTAPKVIYVVQCLMAVACAVLAGASAAESFVAIRRGLRLCAAART